VCCLSPLVIPTPSGPPLVSAFQGFEVRGGRVSGVHRGVGYPAHTRQPAFLSPGIGQQAIGKICRGLGTRGVVAVIVGA
jgi:hypothetical protein